MRRRYFHARSRKEFSLIAPGAGSIGVGRCWQPSPLSIPLDRLGEPLRETYGGGEHETPAPAHPIRVVKLPHFVGRQEGRPACQSGHRRKGYRAREHQWARQIDGHDTAASGARRYLDEIGPAIAAYCAVVDLVNSFRSMLERPSHGSCEIAGVE